MSVSIIKYDLRTRDLLQIPAAKSMMMFGTDSIKRSSSAPIFKRNIRNWSGDECNCKI